MPRFLATSFLSFVVISIIRSTWSSRGMGPGAGAKHCVVAERASRRSAGTSRSGPGAVLYRGSLIGFVADNNRGEKLVACALAHGGPVGARAIKYLMDPG